MKSASYTLFETSPGACGIAWGESGDSIAPPVVTAVQPPETTTQATESRIARRSGSSSPGTPFATDCRSHKKKIAAIFKGKLRTLKVGRSSGTEPVLGMPRKLTPQVNG